MPDLYDPTQSLLVYDLTLNLIWRAGFLPWPLKWVVNAFDWVVAKDGVAENHTYPQGSGYPKAS